MTISSALQAIARVILYAGLLLPVLTGTPLRAQTPIAREVGCYPDNRKADPSGTSGRDLDGAGFKDPSMTVKRCQRLCADQDFSYAGLQDGSWCFCGNNYGRYNTGAAKCTTKCAGDEKQICGGEWANSVWELHEVRPDAPLQKSSEKFMRTVPQLATELQEALRNLGCYTMRVDGDWGRGSRAAVQRFNAISGMSLPTDLPTQRSLEAISSWRGGNCEVATKHKTPSGRKGKYRSGSTKKKLPSSGGSIRIIIEGPGGIGIGF